MRLHPPGGKVPLPGQWGERGPAPETEHKRRARRARATRGGRAAGATGKRRGTAARDGELRPELLGEFRPART